ncbi:MAG: hypothetical protein LBV75_01640 [Paludibacter sp.]|jgi:hypothetical protein|nr:hypothetical protein [Paludibacter sp.]
MIFRFILISDEAVNFKRIIEIDSEASFLSFNNAILDAVKFDKSQMTSFFICNDDWEKEQEVTLIEMDSSSEYDNYVMESTQIDELVSEEGQKLLFVFDVFWERSFFIELVDIITGETLDKPRCTISEGKAPVQIMQEDAFTIPDKIALDDSFYGDEEFDIDEMDEEGFGEINFDENPSML